MNEAALYPGIGAIEATNLSVGRGTDTPFEHVGAPWIDGVQLADALNARAIPGVRFYPVRFTPVVEQATRTRSARASSSSSPTAPRSAPVRVGVEIASALSRLYPAQYQLDLAARLLGSRDALARIKTGDDPAVIAASFGQAEARWRLLRVPLPTMPCQDPTFRSGDCSEGLGPDELPYASDLKVGPTRLDQRRLFLSTYIRSSAIWMNGMMSVASAGTSTQPMLRRDARRQVGELLATSRRRPAAPGARRIASCSPHEISTRNSSPPHRKT